ncbi:hypothetical protein CY34DRAFT_647113 [Suillus luteus UH-Slu-Lm8-n1]|uniref:Protein kinase domain-containing protein n=1 Tax=Suillus luteus UH-Slu-Lm8-n1 TaxID=930992 RepID=A0A0D0AJA4_9AGAM|nr:hypothetical protein CY34DRAFT_647113 [Suillus luteus UH-Slu-Lm8-n1]
MASDITANDLVGIVDKTELISKSHLPTRFPTEVWKGTFTFRGRSAVITIKIMRQLMLPDYESLLVEARPLYTCKHPNLVRFIGTTYELDGKQGMYAPCLITRFFGNGSIMEYLAKPENANVVRMNLLRQIFAGLAHLHSKSIVHGNLKSTNILIDDNGNAKLADYGLSPIPSAPCPHCSPWILELPSNRYKAPESDSDIRIGSMKLLTDPQILTDPSVGQGKDLFGEGTMECTVSMFEKQHKCNEFCEWPGFGLVPFATATEDENTEETEASADFRIVSEHSCMVFLGFGLYNVNIFVVYLAVANQTTFLRCTRYSRSPCLIYLV